MPSSQRQAPLQALSRAANFIAAHTDEQPDLLQCCFDSTMLPETDHVVTLSLITLYIVSVQSIIKKNIKIITLFSIFKRVCRDAC